MSRDAEATAIATADPRWKRSGMGECPKCQALHPWRAPDKTPTCPSCWDWAGDPGAPSVPTSPADEPRRAPAGGASPGAPERRCGPVLPHGWHMVRVGLLAYREGRSVCVPIEAYGAGGGCRTLVLSRDDAVNFARALNVLAREIPAVDRGPVAQPPKQESPPCPSASPKTAPPSPPSQPQPDPLPAIPI